MKTFKTFVRESNTTAILGYGPGPEDDGFDFQVAVPREFDVKDYPIEDDKTPWEVANALQAARHRELINRFLKAAGANSKQAVNSKSLAPVPDWQQHNGKKKNR
jgi:hypothetical protein